MFSNQEGSDGVAARYPARPGRARRHRGVCQAGRLLRDGGMAPASGQGVHAFPNEDLDPQAAIKYLRSAPAACTWAGKVPLRCRVCGTTSARRSWCCGGTSGPRCRTGSRSSSRRAPSRRNSSSGVPDTGLCSTPDRFRPPYRRPANSGAAALPLSAERLCKSSAHRRKPSVPPH